MIVGIGMWTALMGCESPPPLPPPQPLDWRAEDGVRKSIAADSACARGEGEACWWLGLERRWGPVEDPTGAWAAWSRGCDHGESRSCKAAAVETLVGHGGARDPETVLARYRAACEAGDSSGCLGESRLKPLARQHLACTTAISTGEAVSEWACADSCDAFGVPAHCASAEDALLALCTRRDAEACTWMAGRQAGEQATNELLWTACDLDDPWACLKLADRVARGEGDNPSPKSLEWLFNQVCDIQLDYGCVQHHVAWVTQ